MTTTHLFGTAVLSIDADEQSAILTIPRLWDGSYERDYAAGLAFLARSGMPYGTPCEVVDSPDADRVVFAWSDTPATPWPAQELHRLDGEARSTLTSDERHAQSFVVVQPLT